MHEAWLTKPRRELDTAAVCRRYGISDSTLDRWLARPQLAFPKPILHGRSRRVWVESDLQAFDTRRQNGLASNVGPPRP